MTSPATRLRTTAALTALLAGSALGLTACGSDDAGTGRVQVVAAFYPLQYVAERVAGEHAEVQNLTQPGKEPHDLELAPNQVAAIADAELVIFESDFQAAVDDAVKENRDGPSVDAAKAVELAPAVDHSEEGHADEEAGHGDEEAGHDEHEHGALDPHFWQDPLKMVELTEAVAKELATVDPDNAADYTANAAALTTDLRTLDGEFTTGLADCARDTVVVNHDAFSYLDRYGIHLEPIAGMSPDAEPTAHDLATLHDLIKEHGITTVFSETLVSKKTAEALAGDLGITTAVLDPLEGLSASAEDNGGDYLTVMRQNLAALQKANAC
ncbi:metal ABC transporter substrate-binding protein [Nocardioides cavernaquae]|uniref:Zinc ABC transporter substrate-binding protein n=1 Tax=Nocardioides cavernaquae TaxID=2321396 RepID=A0A3A5HAG7_9ACTN|nr:metal ABC transporter substrate-binding protein [Nocardioides cavernaquae]RJS47603.1 zinc ABC transporter substrate-binding protein [Nocardioides cavernaquae]